MNIKQWMVGLTTFVLAASTSGVAAASTSVLNTGDNVKLSQETENVTRVNVSNNNSANINQEASTHANTGGNSADRNIGGGSVVSGGVWSGAMFDASANSNVTAVNVPGTVGAAPLFTDVTNTGDNVHVDGRSSSVTDVSVSNNNDAWINQSANVGATTGRNTADRNIGGGTVYSGNVGSSADFSADANHNATAVTVGGTSGVTTGVGSSFGLVNTGDRVHGNTEVSNETVTSVDNWNSLWLSQNSHSHVTTGQNSAERDIYGGGVRSGEVGGSSFFDVTHANTNATMLGVGSSWMFGGMNGWW
ncbi:hypothetical protein HYS00_02405 [Candidatus Microgenomates bacterium]|nr:hypothetical protein [Candidatus Microgenomates bacterium]